MRIGLRLFQRSAISRAHAGTSLHLASAITHSRVTSQQTRNMAEGLSPQNPMPVLSKAGPADEQKAAELPKLSTEDFRIYNRLAVMMDAYVGLTDGSTQDVY